MAKYIVTGPFRVLDQEPGSTLTSKQLVDCNIDWLIESGHIALVGDAATPSEAAPAEVTTSEAAPADNNQEG